MNLRTEPAVVNTTVWTALFQGVLYTVQKNVPAAAAWLTPEITAPLVTLLAAFIAWKFVRPNVTPVTKQDPPQDPPSRSGIGKGEHIIIKGSGRPAPNDEPTQPIKGLAVAVCLLLVGCAGSLEAARSSGASARSSGAAAAASPQRCDTLDDRHRLWGALAKTTGVMAGTAGISTIPVGDRDARVALAAASLVAGAAAATFVYLEESTAESFVRDCQ